ncbi:hypothetical protein ACF3NT_09505 [Naumannella halotolerans]|uniref:PknH-like protein n=1 Tax=Naumannella halotolerans TaxID=993414 RepID=A0A4R7JCS5_9ACTN|nr:hypothetical protein [Naumannella halotolerans]TDT34269.1 hypothetical protein CLV29_1927 [Naumannella halotolerans]
MRVPGLPLASRLLLGLAVTTAAGCTASPPPAAVEPSPSEREVSVAPLPPGETLPPESSPREAPPREATPAAVSAGPLTSEDLPQQVLGFSAQFREPAESEYNPNGTWTHEVESTQAGYEAVPTCEANTGGGWPDPEFALAATYVDDRGRPGNGLLLQFAGEQEAEDYYKTYLDVLESCPSSDGMPSAEEVATGDGWYGGHRDYAGGDRWSEVVAVNGDRVMLVIVNDDEGSDAEALSGLGTELSGR